MSGNYDIELIKELCLAFGPSGCEGEVADLVCKHLTGVADEIVRHRSGYVAAVLRGVPCKGGFAPSHADGRPRRIMLAAHMDEVGFMVRSVDDEGYVRVATVGGIVPTVLPATRVRIRSYKTGRDYAAVFGEKPVHLQGGERGRAPDIDGAYLEFGAESKEQAHEIKPGDFAVFDAPFYRFGSPEPSSPDGTPDENGVKLRAKALDDRLGCATLITAARALREYRDGYDGAESMPADVWFVFTVREEVGGHGATLAANKLAPDVALVLEATAVADVDVKNKDTKPSELVAEQGKGGALSFADRSTLYDPELLEFIMDTDIPCQIKKFVSGGNDAGPIQRSGAGCRVAALSAPARYIHTPANVVDLRDVSAINDLVLDFVKRF